METLAALISREGKLSTQEAVGWVLRLAKRVNEQHQQGLVHGNVSAYTLLIEGRSPHGKGILVDSPRQAEATFYSPERASSGQLSQGDDCWALAVLLFHGLTAQYPFQVNSAIDIARAVALGTPKLLRHGINDPTLQGLFDRTFARDIHRRMSSVTELIQAINQWIQDPSLINIDSLEDDDEDAPTMMMHGVSIGSSQQQQLQAPQAPLPAPRPAAGIPSAPLPAAGIPSQKKTLLLTENPLAAMGAGAPPLPPLAPLPPIPAPPLGSPAQAAPAINPRQSPTLLAERLEEPLPTSPFSKKMLTVIWFAWAVVTFGGAAIEYTLLSR